MLIIDATTNISDTISLKKPHDTNDESHHVDESHLKSSDRNEHADKVSQNIIIENNISKSENEKTGHRTEPNDDVSDLQKLNKASLLVLLDSFVTLKSNREKSCTGLSIGDIPDAFAKSNSENFSILEPSQFFNDACASMGLFINENEVKYLIRLTGAIIRNATSSIELEKSAMCERKKFEFFLNSASSNNYFSSITMANHIKSDSSSSKSNKKYSGSLLSGEEVIGVTGDLGKGERGGQQCIERKPDVKYNEEKKEEEKRGEVVLKMLPLPTAIEGIHVLEFFSGIG